jgi:GNAT superfamily N-acetyltransferase
VPTSPYIFLPEPFTSKETTVMPAWEIVRGADTISDDRAKLDLDVIHGFLTRSYWAEGIKRERIQRAIDNSFPFGLYRNGRQIGFARVLSDLSAIAYLMDVFVLEEYRGEGLGKWLVENVLEYPAFEPVRRWMLATEDAHELYRKYGFGPYEPASDLMMKLFKDKYRED